MKSEIIIRQEMPEDFGAVFEVNYLAFNRNDEAKLVEALRENRGIFIPELSIVACKDNEIIGYILFTKIKITSKNGNDFESLALAPMAVKPGHQKKGIGAMLIKNGLETAKRLGFESVIVLGHESYYPKFGFEPAENRNIKCPFDVPSEVFMALELVRGSLSSVSGTVIYPEEFESA